MIENGHKITFASRDCFSSFDMDDYDLVVLWQSDSLLSELHNSSVQVICIPMLDEALDKKSSYFDSSSNVKYISFSRTLHYFLKWSGHDSMHLQYWPRYLSDSRQKKHNIAFFWERNPTHLDYVAVKKFANANNLHLYYRFAPDPHDHLSKHKYFMDEKTTIISDWTDKQSLMEILESCSYFITPRPWEGIGLTLLDAISVGCVCIAFDHPTMNEYVSNSNGYLFKNAKQLTKLKIRNFESKYENNKYRALMGRKQFEIDTVNINSYLLEKRNKKRKVAVIPKTMTLRMFTYFIQFEFLK
jgi:glycosyltransferase involved in cell wall biosynthesis